MKTCDIASCDRPHRANGLCSTHYSRVRRRGSVDDPVELTLDAMLWRYIGSAEPGACWDWQGSRTNLGYGQLMLRKKTLLAHRVAWQLIRGEIPAGLQLDHLCRNRGCVNPDHLEPVTVRKNILRGMAPPAKNARKTQCSRGHELSGPNMTIIAGRRQCKTCGALRSRMWWKRKQSRIAALEADEP
jgi:hypothetical protein